MNHGGSLVMDPRGAYHVCLTSLTFFANSSFYEDIVPKDQRAWYSGFKAGLSCSCHKTDNSPALWPNKATSSMLRQFGHFEKCGHVFFVFGFPLEDIKRAMLQPAHVWDLRRSSWSNKLSAILDLRKIRRFLVVTFAPLEVAFRQFTIHVIHLDHQESELWPRSVASHFYGLIQIIIFAFLSFRKIGSLVLVEALA